MSTATITQAQPKYCIAQLLRDKYGELRFKQGVTDLQKHCLIKRKQTIADWLTIEAGSSATINHLVLDKVLAFFGLQEECQLFTESHNNMLKN